MAHGRITYSLVSTVFSFLVSLRVETGGLGHFENKVKRVQKNPHRF
jgi:hypothetical protein